VKKNGGQIIKPKYEEGEYGYAAVFKDTEANTLALWSMKK